MTAASSEAIVALLSVLHAARDACDRALACACYFVGGSAGDDAAALGHVDAALAQLRAARERLTSGVGRQS